MNVVDAYAQRAEAQERFDDPGAFEAAEARTMEGRPRPVIIRMPILSIASSMGERSADAEAPQAA